MHVLFLLRNTTKKKIKSPTTYAHLEKAVHRRTSVTLKPRCFPWKSEKFLRAPSLIRTNYQLTTTIYPQTMNQRFLCNWLLGNTTIWND